MRILHEFRYERPKSLGEALALLEEHGDKARLLAGGTDLVVAMKYRSLLQLVPGAGTPDALFPAARAVPPMLEPEVVVSLAALTALKGVKTEGDTLWIGPLSTMAEIASSRLAADGAGALGDAAGSVGSPLVRNRATVGGNVMNARPAADTAVALLALGARFEIAGPRGTRTIDAAGFFAGPGRTAAGASEILVGIRAPLGANEGSAYVRQGARRQLEIAIVGAAAWVKLDPASGNVADCRVALGAVGPTPILAPKGGAALTGKKPDSDAIAAAALAARDDARPIDDHRGSRAYRLELVEALAGRALTRAIARARGGEVRP